MAERIRGRQITGGQREKLASELRGRYEAGHSVRLLARELGRSYGFVHNLLGESGATMRRRGGNNNRSRGQAA